MQQYLTINKENIAYSDVGEGPVIVCVHGWAMCAATFSNLADALSSRFRVISIDLAGCGESRSAQGPYSIERAADDIEALCDVLNLTNIVALGWSMGMQVWWEYISTYGESRLSALVSEDMSPKIYNNDSWQNGTLNGRRIDGLEAMIDDMHSDWTTFTYRFIPRIFALQRGYDWAHLAEYLIQISLKNDPHIMSEYWRSMASKDYRGLLPGIHSKTLLVHGVLSQLYGPGLAEFLCENLPDAHLVNFKHSGHAPHLEQPDMFKNVLTNFLSDI